MSLRENAAVPHVLVCVTRQITCARLITAGRKMADQLTAKLSDQHSELSVVHVLGMQDAFLGVANTGDVLEALFQAAQQVGASMAMLRSDDPLTALADHARAVGATHLVLGTAPDGDNRFAQALQGLLPGVAMEIVGESC